MQPYLQSFLRDGTKFSLLYLFICFSGGKSSFLQLQSLSSGLLFQILPLALHNKLVNFSFHGVGGAGSGGSRPKFGWSFFKEVANFSIKELSKVSRHVRSFFHTIEVMQICPLPAKTP